MCIESMKSMNFKLLIGDNQVGFPCRSSLNPSGLLTLWYYADPIIPAINIEVWVPPAIR